MIQLEMLLEVDRICKKRHIQYCIIAGTTLGAVRHKGYIPWDDDADVAMLRSEYDKFCQVCEEELDTSRFYLQTPSNTEQYRWGYGKIRRKGTEFIRQGQEHLNFPMGIFIDIFPLDNVPDNRVLRGVHNFVCTLVRKTLWSPVGAKTHDNKFFKWIYKFLSLIPKKIVFNIYDLLKNVSNVKETKLVRILTFPTPRNRIYGYYRKWYSDLTELEFEGFLFPAAKNYHEYLSFKFGNYNVLPPMEQRLGHPVSKYKLLDKSEFQIEPDKRS